MDASGTVTPLPGDIVPLQGQEESVYGALVQGTRDYVDKHRFPGRGAGLVRRHRFGVDPVHRGRCAGRGSRAFGGHALALHLADEQGRRGAAGARGCKVKHSEISIEGMFEATLAALKDEFAGRAPDTAEENIQSRCRGVLLDGHFQQDRQDAAHHGQQERNGGGLRDPVRRHGGRLRPHQGLQQAAGVSAVRLAQCPVAGHSGAGHRAAAVGGAAPRAEGHRQPAALRDSRSHPRGLHRGGSVGGSDRGARLRPRRRWGAFWIW